MNWKISTLSEACSIKTGKLNSNAAVQDGEFPFFTCSPQTLRINKCSFDTEAVLLAGNNAAGIYPLKYYKGKFDAYQRTYVLESIDNRILNTRYLYYTLIPVLGYFQSISIGAATQYLTKAVLDNFKFKLPPLPTQKKIVSILSAYDDLIENNLKRIALLEKSARLLYEEWFVRLRFPGYEHTDIVEGVPEGWEKKKIGDTITLNYGKALKESDRVEGGFPVYGSSGVVGSHEKFLVEGPAIIVGRKGNVGSVYWSDKNCWPIDTVYYISSAQTNLYLYYNLQYQPFINSDAAVPGLNRNHAYNLDMILPPKGILDQFDAFVRPVHQQSLKLQSQNEKLKQARDILLPKLINGEITV